MNYELHCGDCLDILPTFGADSIDSIVCDPPYGLSFMGKNWDHGIPGVPFWEAALRVAKPGAHLLAFGGTRTFHRLACAIEDAGWEIRDTVMWVYGGGFPKSLDVSKAIDKAAGAEREVVDLKRNTFGRKPGGGAGWAEGVEGQITSDHVFSVTAPATEAARKWDGWGTALKPAWEPVIVARKPLIGTVAENVLAHGTGGLNIDGCRVGTEGYTSGGRNNSIAFGRDMDKQPRCDGNKGRWPANVIHDGSDEVVGLFPVTGKSGRPIMYSGKKYDRNTPGKTCFFQYNPSVFSSIYEDTGSAARFFQQCPLDDEDVEIARLYYCAKASKRDRDEGCEGLGVRQVTGGGGGIGEYLSDVNSASGKYGSEKAPSRNHHPTVKPTALMRYLCRLVTPPGGLVLDPFMGSGSTGKAALLEGFRFVGIEREPDYCEIARCRCAAVQPGLFDEK